MRSILLLTLAIVACSAPATAPMAARPTGINAVFDPGIPAPTNVTATVVKHKAHYRYVTIAWTDTCDGESFTSAYFLIDGSGPAITLNLTQSGGQTVPVPEDYNSVQIRCAFVAGNDITFGPFSSPAVPF